MVDEYLDITLRHLEAGTVSLVVVGGAPGTGKSTIAALLADRLGAVLLSTDTIRREVTPAGSDRYSDQSRGAVYRVLLAHAERALSVGETVIADATWPTESVRQHARECAARTRSRLVEFECQAPVELSAIRAQRRLDGGVSSSDAGAVVARQLAACREPWPSASPVDCSGSPDEAVADAVVVLASVCPTQSGRFDC
jgi:hypothetical protein